MKAFHNIFGTLKGVRENCAKGVIFISKAIGIIAMLSIFHPPTLHATRHAQVIPPPWAYGLYVHVLGDTGTIEDWDDPNLQVEVIPIYGTTAGLVVEGQINGVRGGENYPLMPVIWHEFNPFLNPNGFPGDHWQRHTGGDDWNYTQFQYYWGSDVAVYYRYQRIDGRWLVIDWGWIEAIHIGAPPLYDD